VGDLVHSERGWHSKAYPCGGPSEADDEYVAECAISFRTVSASRFRVVLTRIELDGFKTFTDFALDLQPLTVIAGTNASGKSNLFDAIQFLAALADEDLRTALSAVRGEPHELFTRRGDGSYVDRMRLAVEVLVDPTVRDPWGQEQQLNQTRLRYEVGIERRMDENGLERMYVAHETAEPVRSGEDRWAKRLKAAPEFKREHFAYVRRSPYLETDAKEKAFRLHRDGSQGRVRLLPAVYAEATVLSSITTAEFGHLFALREEIRSWRFLQLDPVSLRAPASYQAPERLQVSGANLAAVLARMKTDTADEDNPRGVLAELSADVAHLIPGLTEVDVRDDLSNRRWELLISTREQAPYTARVASDGTLRILALLTALSDPDHGGVLAFEEPENGVHPARLPPLIDHVRSLVTDPSKAPTGRFPLLQLLVTTHSPVVVRSLRANEGVYFDATTLTGDPEVRRTRVRRIELERTTPIFDANEVRDAIPAGEVDRYLAGRSA
jgi:predicted ATPase